MPYAVAPRCNRPASPSAHIGPAMSMCAHGVPEVNSSKNNAAVIAPASGPPILRISAIYESIIVRYLRSSGNCQICSSVAPATDYNFARDNYRTVTFTPHPKQSFRCNSIGNASPRLFDGLFGADQRIHATITFAACIGRIRRRDV